jgi:multidrug efflux pump subunit AcrA (membrane-fusion protein)
MTPEPPPGRTRESGMRRRRRRWELTLGLVALAGLLLWWAAAHTGTGALGAFLGRESPPGPSAGAPPAPSRLEALAALGRIEPRHGVIRVAGPPRPAVVIQELLVEEGDAVKRGQVIALLAGIGVQRADVARLRAELENAERELERNRKLRSDRVLSESEWQARLLARDVARANLERAGAELELSTVRSPIDGQVLEIRAREGERAGGMATLAVFRREPGAR